MTTQAPPLPIPSPSNGADWLLPLLDNTPVSVACWDGDERMLFASAAWSSWYDIPHRNVVGSCLQSLLPPAAYHALSDRLAALERGEAAEYDESLAHGGRVAPSRRVQLSHVAHPGTGERLVCMVMTDTTRDQARHSIMQRQQDQITALQQALQAYQNDGAELERLRTLLEWRTNLLTERNDMLHLLSHEIRQPLNNASAAMQASLAAIHGLGIDNTNAASRALLRAENVLHQVIGTLDNTLAAGTILTLVEKTSPADDTDLPTLIKLTLHDIAADARARIVTDWQTETRTVQLHPALMRLAIRNLLHNALSYAPPDSAVTLRISEIDDPLALIIEVIDTGTGIPDDLRPRLFDRGSRGNNSHHRAGAGLGLFIVRSVMQLHRGKVEVESNVPQGTIMRLVAPQGVGD